MKAIIITADGKISQCDVEKNGEPLYDLVRKTVDGFMEHIYFPGLPGYIGTVDEEGKLKEKPVNVLATRLYQNPLDFLVGDVIILKYGTFEGDSDIVGIPDEEANQLMNLIKEKVLNV
ncbi:MAG: DUF3846 domain-containing protein [Clostridia bacterium]|nr:DUF3846 domain-containing protein [Clostridia bacterium]